MELEEYFKELREELAKSLNYESIRKLPQPYRNYIMSEILRIHNYWKRKKYK